MSFSSDSILSIGPIAAADRHKALGIVFSHLPAEQCREQIEGLTLPSSGATGKEMLVGAFRGGGLVGAGLAQVQPGRTVQVWLPRTVGDEPSETAVKILQALCGSFEDSGMALAQMIVESVTPADEELIRRGGFDYLAELFYLVCPECDYPRSPPVSPLEFECYNPDDSTRFARLVENTYHGTKDCPILNGLRKIEDVLEGYRATGVFDPGRWFIVKQDVRDIGCLLLADHPAYGNVELVYMGVIPAARGKDFGRHIARFAEWQARQLGRARLVLAVDGANGPALTMYEAAGFQTWDRRGVYYQVFSRAKKTAPSPLAPG
jgi:mycothiol synthase